MSSAAKYHDLPPGVSGVTRGYLVVTVDEILWLVDTGPRAPPCHVRAEWWGSSRDQQAVFAPVDVRNFVQNGLMIHSYPVNTGKEKLRQYFMDASPLTLSLYTENQKEALGQAFVILDHEKIEGYFPVLSESGDELATIHVKLDYVDSAKSHDGNNLNVKNVKNSRVTFPTHIEEITFQADSSTANSKSTKIPDGKKPCEGQRTQSTQEDFSFLSSVSNSNSIPNPGKVRPKTATASVNIKISNFSLKNFIFDKLFESQSKEKQNLVSVRQTLPKIFVFVNFTFPGKKDATFCARLSELNKIEFNESKVFDEVHDDKDLDSYNIEFDVSLRIMGLKSSVQVGSASVPLKSLLPKGSPRPVSVSADIVASPSLFKYIGVRQCLYGQNVGQVTIVSRKDSISQKEKSSTLAGPKLGTNLKEVISPTIPKMPPIKSNVRKITPQCPDDPKVPKKPHCIIGNQSSDVVSVVTPVFIRLGVFCSDEQMSSWANIRIKWWTGRQCYGFGSLECSEVILKPETEGRFYNRQSLSSLLDNYLVLELWRHDEIVGIGRVPTHGLHGAAQSWRGRGVTCYDDKVEIVSVTSGQVMGQFRVSLSLDDRGLAQPVEKSREDKSVDTAEDAPEIEEVSLDNEQHSVHEVEVSVNSNNSIESHSNAMVHLEEVRISKTLDRVYCSLPGGSASVCFSSDEPVWDVHMVTELPPLGADNNQSQMIMRLWCADAETPDMDRDKMFGFVSVDCSPLQLGFPYIRGWYNIIDWLGKPKGQVKITVKPNSSLPSACLPIRLLGQQNVVDIVHTSPSYPSPPTVHYQLAETDIVAADTEGESLSFMELALSNHLKDLNLMTNNLGNVTID